MRSSFLNTKFQSYLITFAHTLIVCILPNRSYYNMFYNYCVRLTHVINWRKKNSYAPVAKLGEHICDEKKTLVNFFHDKKHWSCCGLYR